MPVGGVEYSVLAGDVELYGVIGWAGCASGWLRGWLCGRLRWRLVAWAAVWATGVRDAGLYDWKLMVCRSLSAWQERDFTCATVRADSRVTGLRREVDAARTERIP